MSRNDAHRRRFAGWSVAVAVLLTAFAAGAQDQPEKRFFQVKLAAENGFAYDRLAFQGDFFEFQAKAGTLVTGVTEQGVTVVIIVGDVELRISPANEEYHAGIQEAFGTAPAILQAKRAYLRLHPTEYGTLTQGATLTPRTDSGVFKTAKALFDDKFNGSYHAGPLAIIPPAGTFFCDLDAEKVGHVIFEEGEILRLTRIAPYKAVYPARMLNPKR